jgi:hypothetical protein
MNNLKKGLINFSNFTKEQLNYLAHAARTAKVLNLQAQLREPNPDTRRAKYMRNYKKQQNKYAHATATKKRKGSRKHRKTYRK